MNQHGWRKGIALAGQVCLVLGLLYGAVMPVPEVMGTVMGAMGLWWRRFGIVCALWVLADVALGKKADLLSDGGLCVYFLWMLLAHYRFWCRLPQVWSYLFPLLAGVCLMGFSYQRAARTVGLGNGRWENFFGIFAALWAFRTGWAGEQPMFYLACCLWAVSCLLTQDKKKEG